MRAKKMEGLDMPLEFKKMHGAGNHFVIVDSRSSGQRICKALAQRIGDPQRGVGFDQLCEIREAEPGRIHLDFWNADGSLSAACGNATRCVAHILMTEKGVTSLWLETARGQLEARRLASGQVEVNMGPPILDWQAIPLREDVDLLHLPIAGDPLAVGMGNPHCVFFTTDLADTDVASRGAALEHHALFPERTNVEFVEVRSRTDLRMRVWERGTGITLACGSGACAALVAAHQRGLCDRKVAMEVDGGLLGVDWRDDGVWLTGPTAQVFDGSFSDAFLAGDA